MRFRIWMNISCTIIEVKSFDLNWAVIMCTAALIQLEVRAQIVVAVGDVVEAAPLGSRHYALHDGPHIEVLRLIVFLSLIGPTNGTSL